MNKYPNIKELEAMGAIWIDLKGNDAKDCKHDIQVHPLGGAPIVSCTECGKTAEQIQEARRFPK